MLLHSALSAGTYIAGKRALAELSPAQLAVTRFALATLVHGAVLWKLRVRFERRDLLGLAGLGVLGVAGARDVLVGDVLLLFAVMTWALYAVGGKVYAARYGGLAAGSGTLVAGTIVCAPAGLALAFRPERLAALSPWGVASVAYLVVVTSVLAWLIYYWALGRAEASRVAIWSNLQPVLTALLAWAVYGEALTGPFLAGGAMVVAGVLMTERG